MYPIPFGFGPMLGPTFGYTEDGPLQEITVTLSAAINPKAMANLRRIAELAGVSVEEAVTRLLENYVEKVDA